MNSDTKGGILGQFFAWMGIFFGSMTVSDFGVYAGLALSVIFGSIGAYNTMKRTRYEKARLDMIAQIAAKKARNAAPLDELLEYEQIK